MSFFLQIYVIWILAAFGIYLAISQYYYVRRHNDLIDEIEELKQKYGRRNPLM